MKTFTTDARYRISKKKSSPVKINDKSNYSSASSSHIKPPAVSALFDSSKVPIRKTAPYSLAEDYTVKKVISSKKRSLPLSTKNKQMITSLNVELSIPDEPIVEMTNQI